MTLPVPHDKMEEVSQKVSALALPPPAAGQFLVPELLEGWEPAQVEGQELQLNIRVSARKPLPQQMELLELILGDAVKARQVLRHGLLSLQKGYQSSSRYPAAGPETANPRHEAARSLLEEEKRLVALGLASLEAKAQEAAEEVDFDESALLRMQGCTVTLQEIAASFASLKAGEAEARMKLAELQVVRACLAGLPDGNPEAVHTVPLVQTKDPVLRAHGEATRAVLESRLAACEWEIATLDGSQAALQAGVMGEAAALQVKMLKFQDAYEKLAMSLQLMPSDVARRLKLDCAVALACRRQLCCDDISWSDVSKEGQLLKKRLKSLGYTASHLPQAAGVPSVLHLVSNRAGALEQKLQEQSSSPDLKDLLRLFLLRQPLPSQRVVDLLSRSVVALLLRIQALFAVADGHQLMSHQDVTAMDLTDLTAENVEIFSAVAWWPVEDLLIATDYGDTQHAAGHFEPVMYLSLDSYALIDAAPRRSAESVLDICCGSGVQGLVALHYAAKATFLDVNPRAISFSRFNAGLNGLHQRCTFLEGSVFDAKQLQGQSFQVILANPPFVPNPDGTASAAGPLYSGGGQDGEEVHKELVQKGLGLLAPGGRLCSVAEVPNPKTFPNRVGEWIDKVDCKRAGSVKIFTGKTIASEEYWKTATEERSPLEWRRYLRGLRRLGVTSVAEALLLLQLEEVGSAPLSIEAICRENLWQDVEYLRGCVAHSID